MAITKEDKDRKLMMKIIGGFQVGVCHISPQVAIVRHFGRMIMLTRWKFLRYCERNQCGELSLDGFGHGLHRATIGMWMDEPYMKMYNTEGKDVILAQFPVETIKEIYNYIKGLN